jgi:hypothetical protein
MSRPEPRFDRDYAYGVQGELLVDDLIAGLASGQLRREDKRKTYLDARLYIEVEQNPLACGRWRDSGLATTTADVWTYTVHDTGAVFVLPVAMLRRAVEHAQRHGVRPCPGPKGENPTRGYLLPVDEIVRWGST